MVVVNRVSTVAYFEKPLEKFERPFRSTKAP